MVKKRREKNLRCERCNNIFDGVIVEENVRGIVEQLMRCPECNYKYSIIFYDEMLDELIEEYYEFVKKNGNKETNQVVNYKKKIRNLIIYLKNEAENRSDFRGSYIRVPEDLRYLVDSD